MNAMKTSVCGLLLLLGIFIFCTGCQQSGRAWEQGTFRINIAAEPPSLDWVITTDSTSFDVISNLMIGLTQYTPQLTCAPACAQSWEILAGGKIYRFHLRKDVLWSDGKPVTAHDFEYSWQRLLNPATGAQYAYFLYDIKNAFAYNTGLIKDSSQVGIRCPDDYTFEIELEKPSAYFIYLSAFCPTLPQRKDIVEKWGNHWTDPEHLVCNGPFLLSKWEHEYKIELVANPHFVEGPPKIQKVKMFMIPEQGTAFALYENNQLDFIDNRSFPTPDVERNRTSSEYRNFPLLRGNYIGFNTEKPPFTDERVRLAFSMAIDRKIFPKILRRGERSLATWIPPELIGYSKDSEINFDPVTARKLLAQAGYPDGRGFPKAELLYPNREDTKLVVEAVQDQFKRNLNIQVTLLNQEWRVYLERLHRDPPLVFRGSWGADYPDPETFMNLFTTHNGNNWTHWSDPYYDDLLTRARAEQDKNKRAKLYEKADTYLCKTKATIAPTYLSTQNSMIKPWVHGIDLNALDLQFFKTITIGD
jgi:oligopeptide transport system substrate-binding protein